MRGPILAMYAYAVAYAQMFGYLVARSRESVDAAKLIKYKNNDVNTDILKGYDFGRPRYSIKFSHFSPMTSSYLQRVGSQGRHA